MSVMRFFCCNLPFLKDFFTHFPLVAGKQPIPPADDRVHATDRRQDGLPAHHQRSHHQGGALALEQH